MAPLEAKVRELIKHPTGLKRGAVQLASRLREADAKLARHVADSRRWEKEREWLRGRLRKILSELALIEHREDEDRKSTRLNSSHSQISYAVLCWKKKTAAAARPRLAPGGTQVV